MANDYLIMSQSLSNIQLELLKTFSQNVSDEDLLEIKRLLTRYFAEKGIKEANKVWDSEGWSEESVDDLLKSHKRTPYSSENK